MIKAIIVDDEPAAGAVIYNLVHSFSTEVNICCTCRTIDSAVQEIQRHHPDILFLDIELAEGSGFEILERLPGLQFRTVFITAYEQYALKAIKHHAFDYLLKPLVPAEFRTMLDKVLNDIKKPEPAIDHSVLLRFLKEHTPQRIAIPIRSGFQYYDLQDIVLLEGQGSYTNMYLTDNRQVLVTRILKDFESTLTDSGFLRVHKSFLINMRYVAALHKEDSGYLVMNNGKTVPISAKDKEAILGKLQAFVNIV